MLYLHFNFNHFSKISLKMRPSDPRLFPTMEFLRRRFRLHSRLAVNVLSELFATFLFLLIGTGLVAQFILTAGKINSYMQVYGSWMQFQF